MLLKVKGFNEKLYKLVEIIGETMKNLTEGLTEENLHMFIESELSFIYNLTLEPSRLAQ